PSFWNAPEPTTVFSAILFHCSTVLPGGKAAAAFCAVPAAPAKATAATAIARARTCLRMTFISHSFRNACLPLLARLRTGGTAAYPGSTLIGRGAGMRLRREGSLLDLTGAMEDKSTSCRMATPRSRHSFVHRAHACF